METLSIIKGLDLPKRASTKRAYKYPFETMEIGDSFFVPDMQANDFASYAGSVGRKLKRRFTTRTVRMRMIGKTWELCEPGAEDGSTQGTLVMRVATKDELQATA